MCCWDTNGTSHVTAQSPINKLEERWSWWLSCQSPTDPPTLRGPGHLLLSPQLQQQTRQCLRVLCKGKRGHQLIPTQSPSGLLPHGGLPRPGQRLPLRWLTFVLKVLQDGDDGLQGDAVCQEELPGAVLLERLPVQALN